jgi:RimJ/RimL family protein N-acetyltransferase
MAVSDHVSAAPRVSSKQSELHLGRIEIVVAVNNRGSRRAAERLGAKLEGTARRRLVVNDESLDACIYSLVSEDL